LVKLQNFGCDTKGIFGYYKSNWFVAAEVSFDKAIVTHFKHTDDYKSDFLEVIHGWYQPATGGNFSYGLQTGYSFRNSDITFKAVKVLTQDFETEPILPVYFQLGYNKNFKLLLSNLTA